MDNIACLKTRLEYWSRRQKKYKSFKNLGLKYNEFKHKLIKRAVDSMDDCIEGLEEPLFGFRVNITQEIQCSALGRDLQNGQIFPQIDVANLLNFLVEFIKL